MRVEKLNPDWQWTRYQKVTATRDNFITSNEQKYWPGLDGETLHRRLSRAYDDQRIRQIKIVDIVSNWLSEFGVLSGGIDEFDEHGFIQEAGHVWWMIQVFNVLRSYEYYGAVGLDPAAIDSTDALTLMLNVPNPRRIKGADSNFPPYEWATRPALETKASLTENVINQNFQASERNLSIKSATWQITYLDLLEVLAITIRKKLNDNVQLDFETLNSKEITHTETQSETALLREFSFLNVPRDANGIRTQPKISIEEQATPLGYGYKIDAVLCPKDLLAYIWLLVAEEFTEIPNVDFVNCKGFADCGNTLKRARSRPCKHCQKSVYSVTSYQSSDLSQTDDLINQAVPVHLQREEWGDSENSTIQGVTVLVHKDDDGRETDLCTKSPDELHEQETSKKEWCNPTCRSKNT